MEDTLSRSLDSATSDFDEFLRKQQRKASRVWRLKNAINRKTKIGIGQCIVNDIAALQATRQEIKTMWEELVSMEAMDHIFVPNWLEAGKEIAEFEFVVVLLPYILNDKEFGVNSFNSVLYATSGSRQYIPLPAVLVGLTEAVSELRKIKDEILGSENLNQQHRKKIRQRFIQMAKMIHARLLRLGELEVSDAVMLPPVFGENRYQFSFRGRLNFLERIISEETAELARIIDYQSLIRE